MGEQPGKAGSCRLPLSQLHLFIHPPFTGPLKQGGDLFSFSLHLGLLCLVIESSPYITGVIEQLKQDMGREEELFCCGDIEAGRQDGEKFPAAIARAGTSSSRTVCVAGTHGFFLFSSCKYLSCLSNYVLNHFGLEIKSYLITLLI